MNLREPLRMIKFPQQEHTYLFEVRASAELVWLAAELDARLSRDCGFASTEVDDEPDRPARLLGTDVLLSFL